MGAKIPDPRMSVKTWRSRDTDPTPRIPSTPFIITAEFHKMASVREKWKVPQDQEGEIEGGVSAGKTRYDPRW